MSRINPIVIHDSDSESAADSVEDSAEGWVVADLERSDSAIIHPVAAASVKLTDFSSWKSGSILKSNRGILFDSGSETETESEAFKTPPSFKTMSAKWQDNEKLGEDTGEPMSPPYDPFGPTHDHDSDVDVANQIEEDRQFAVFLDMDMNGRAARNEANERLKVAFDEEKATKEEQKDGKKDRKRYWAKRYAAQKAKSKVTESVYFVQTYFCGGRNYHRTFKKGSHGELYKRAVIPGSAGSIQHDLVISSNKTFYNILGDVVTPVLPDENGKVFVRENCVPDVDVLFRTTFPEPVFPFV